METQAETPAAKVVRQVKNMDEAIWNRAVEHAGERRESLAEWIGRAIVELADAEEGKPSLMPRAGNPAETPFPLAMLPAAPPRIESASDFGALMAGAAAMAAASGVPVPAAHAKGAFALMGQSLRLARGLSAKRGQSPNLRVGPPSRATLGKPDGNPAGEGGQ